MVHLVPWKNLQFRWAGWISCTISSRPFRNTMPHFNVGLQHFSPRKQSLFSDSMIFKDQIQKLGFLEISFQIWTPEDKSNFGEQGSDVKWTDYYYIPGFLHGLSIWVADMCHRITAKSGLGHHNFWLAHHFINAGFIFLPWFGEEFHFGKYFCWKWVGTTTLVLKNRFFYSNKSVLDCVKKAMNDFLQQGI